METQPFDLGATERVVKFFGGDKQKMLQAYQSGALRQFAPAPMDQTLLVAAGMLADHMRSAAQQKAAPQQTVAQQTFAPPAPPQQPTGAPPAPSAGLGATPEAAQMQGAMPPMGAPPPQEMAPPPQEMAPPPQEMPAPQGEMPMMAEGGMVPPYAAGGGLSELPVPDTMFDEPRNGGFDDGYAGGGMVAFAAGGAPRETDGQRQERLVLSAIPGTTVTSRQRSAAKNAQVGGNPNSFHMTDQARDFVPPPGMSLTEFGDRVKSILGSNHDVIYNSKGHFDHVHTEPSGKRSSFPTPREVDTNTFAGRGMSFEDQLGFADRLFNKLPREELELAKAERRRELDPVYLEKQKKLNEAEAITAAGLELMAPEEYRGENILGSIAKAVKTGLSAYGTGKKEQKAAKNAAIRELMAYEELDRKTAVAAYGFGMDAYKVGLSADQAKRALAFDEKKLATTISENEKDRAATLAAAKFRTSNPTQYESIMNIIQYGTPDQKLALEKYMKLTKPQTGMGLIPGMDGEMGGDEGPQPVIVGSRPA